jgi:superfamily II RNA helicase
MPKRFTLHTLGHRDHPRAEQPQYSTAVECLAAHDLLPAILFISSRRHCDEAVLTFRHSRLASLDRAWQNRILAEVANFTPEEQEIVLHHRFFKILLTKGVAAHHAGHLPIWKHTVEKLMARGLLRAVFATTTLAAGIDMPARSVVITASSLRDSSGHRDLKAFELAQMTGRAGRRGRDNIGFATFLAGPFQDVALIVDLLQRPPEPIQSQFAANYTMVLNLLQQHRPDAVRELLERSFSQYQNQQKIDRLQPVYNGLNQELQADERGRPCTNRAQVWQRFQRLARERQKADVGLKKIQRRIKQELAMELEPDTEALARSEQRTAEIEAEFAAMLCNTCPQLSSCGQKLRELRPKQERFTRLANQLYNWRNGLWQQFEGCVTILQHFDYLTPDWQPTADGRWAAKLRVDNSLLVAELIKNHYFDTADPQLLAALTGAMAGDREINVAYQEDESVLLPPFQLALQVGRRIQKQQKFLGLSFPIVLDGNHARLLWRWADTRVSWSTLFHGVNAAEGDVVRSVLRTADILHQFTDLQETHPVLASTAQRAITLIRRPPVED